MSCTNRQVRKCTPAFLEMIPQPGSCFAQFNTWLEVKNEVKNVSDVVIRTSDRFSQTNKKICHIHFNIKQIKSTCMCHTENLSAVKLTMIMFILFFFFSGYISTEDFNYSIIFCLYASQKVRHLKMDFSSHSYAWSYFSSGKNVCYFKYIHLYCFMKGLKSSLGSLKKQHPQNNVTCTY